MELQQISLEYLLSLKNKKIIDTHISKIITKIINVAASGGRTIKYEFAFIRREFCEHIPGVWKSCCYIKSKRLPFSIEQFYQNQKDVINDLNQVIAILKTKLTRDIILNTEFVFIHGERLSGERLSYNYDRYNNDQIIFKQESMLIVSGMDDIDINRKLQSIFNTYLKYNRLKINIIISW